MTLEKRMGNNPTGFSGEMTPARRAACGERQKSRWKRDRKGELQRLNTARQQSPVKWLRLELGMNQAEFAVAIGLAESNQSGLSKIEVGRRVPLPANVLRMNQLAADIGIVWDYETMMGAKVRRGHKKPGPKPKPKAHAAPDAAL